MCLKEFIRESEKQEKEETSEKEEWEKKRKGDDK